MKKKKKDTTDWCIDEGRFMDYDVVRCIRSSFKWTSYLAKDKAGNRVTLTYFDRDKLIERYQAMAFQSGTPADRMESEAIKYVREYQQGVKETVDRIKGLGNDHAAETMSCSYDRERDQLVVVSEYVPGVDLFYASGRLKPNQLLCLLAQALDGLDYIHTCGFLHLNVKPSRIVVDFEADPPHVKLTDFGFAIPIKNYAGKYNGTLFYIAPEVALEDRQKIDERADMFSFGVTAYYCITGHQPLGERFVAQSNRDRLVAIVEKEKDVAVPPSHYNKDVPPELDEMILGLLKRNPDERRFANAGDLLNFMYEKWPDESRQMVREATSTLLTYD